MYMYVYMHNADVCLYSCIFLAAPDTSGVAKLLQKCHHNRNTPLMGVVAKIKACAKACREKLKRTCKTCLCGGYDVLLQTHRCRQYSPHLYMLLEMLVFFAGAVLIAVQPLLYSVLVASGLFPVLIVIWVFVSAYYHSTV